MCCWPGPCARSADQGLTELAIPWPQPAIMLVVAVVVGALAACGRRRAVRLPVLKAIAAE